MNPSEKTKDSTTVADGYSVVLDTETTRLGDDAEIIEIAIICAFSGKILINTLVKPKNPIPPSATAIHGIDNEQVANAPIWPEIHDQVMAVIHDKTVLIYNADYDSRLIKQTAEQYDLQSDKIDSLCVMEAYADMLNKGYWEKLVNAARNQGAVVGELHRALGDCQTTRNLVLQIEPAWALEEW
jgi:DNA polymerase-3 subunit epsilon